MKRTLRIQLLSVLVILIPIFGKSQINDSNIRLKVLQKKLIGKELIFGKWNQKGGMETHLTYLGAVKTNQGRIFKIINYVWIWGLSQRATNRILIYNEKNQYVGNYYLTLKAHLPTKLKNRVLIFQNTDDSCDKNTITRVSLKNGLPQEFFRKCKNDFGDIYSFDGIN
jgi:hypothetical protein